MTYVGAADDRAIQANAILDKKVLPHDGLLPEDLTAQLFSLYEIPEPSMIVARKVDDLPRLLETIGFPVVMKVSSPDIIEKSSMEGVCVNIRSIEDAQKAFNGIMAHAREHAPTAGVRGVLVQKYLPHGREFMIRVIREGDRSSMTVGWGSAHIQVQAGTSSRPLPVSQRIAEEMALELKVWEEGTPEIALLAAFLQRLSDLVTEVPVIKELAINPLLVDAEDVQVLDGKVVVERGKYKDAD